MDFLDYNDVAMEYRGAMVSQNSQNSRIHYFRKVVNSYLNNFRNFIVKTKLSTIIVSKSCEFAIFSYLKNFRNFLVKSKLSTIIVSIIKVSKNCKFTNFSNLKNFRIFLSIQSCQQSVRAKLFYFDEFFSVI